MSASSDFEKEYVIVNKIETDENNSRIIDFLAPLENIKGQIVPMSKLRQTLCDISNEIEKYGFFSSVNSVIDKVEGSESIDINGPVPVSVRVGYKELPRVSGNVKAEINTDNDIIASTSINLNNTLKQNEKIGFRFNKTVGGSTEGEAFAEYKIRGENPLSYRLAYFKNVHDMTYFTSMVERTSGITFDISNLSNTKTLSYTNSLRKNDPKLLTSKIERYTEPSSEIIRQSAIPSLKSSIALTSIIHNSIKREQYRTSGAYLKSLTELSGLFGDVSFLKARFVSGLHFPIGNTNFNLHLNSNFGFLYNFKSLLSILSHQNSHINDRFFCGGANSFSGYEQNTLGPKCEDDSVGGDLMFSKRISLSFPLKAWLLRDMRATGFVFGALANVSLCSQMSKSSDKSKGWSGFNSAGSLCAEHVKNIWANTKYSVGCGIDLPLDSLNGAIRLSYTKVLNPYAGDRLAAFQLGVSINEE